MQRLLIGILALLSLIIVACAPSPVRGEDAVSLGETRYSINFTAENDFETGLFPDIGASLRIQEGRYLLSLNGERSSYIWGQGGEIFSDGALEVRATPQSAYENNLYGVMCRVTETGAGYALLISNDGFAAIARSNGRSLAMLMDWREHAAIQKGQSANDIRGICAGSYFALYVNGEFVGDAEDDPANPNYITEGQAGLIGGVIVERVNQSAEVQVSFENLVLRAASLKP